jgi:hypothetical protein
MAVQASYSPIHFEDFDAHQEVIPLLNHEREGRTREYEAGLGSRRVALVEK